MQNVLELAREVGEAQVGVFVVGKISFKLDTAWTPTLGVTNFFFFETE